MIHAMANLDWFGHQDFKVLLLEKPGGTAKAQFTENKGYRWYSQKETSSFTGTFPERSFETSEPFLKTMQTRFYGYPVRYLK